jgi:bacterioferritin-associated ferredoxin
MPKIICLCNQVSQKQIQKIVQRHPSISLSELIQVSGASTSCGRCRTELKAEYLNIITQVQANQKDAQGVLPFFNNGSDLSETP